MKYRTENEFEQFGFDETFVKDVEVGPDYFRIWLDNVKILPDNSCNRDIRTMRTNGLQLTITDMKIVSFIREGVKIYNADGVPMGSREDEVVAEEDYMDIFALFLEGQAYCITKEEGEKCVYTFVVDAKDEATYEVKIAGSGEAEEWDRFMSLDAM